MKKVGKTLLHISLIMLLSILAIASTLSDSAAAQTSYPVLSQETVASGTKYATQLYIIRSSNPGPVVMFVSGVHGNETAGYTAASILKDYRINKGTLLILPKANLRAIQSDVRRVSGEKDLNRSFPQSTNDSADTGLAKEIYNVVKRYKVDWLVDMHEGANYTQLKSSSSVGQSLIYYPDSATRNISQKIVASLNQNISTSYKKFSLLTYPVKGSLSRASAQYLGANSFIFETCSRQLLSTRVGYQLKAAGILLSSLEMK